MIASRLICAEYAQCLGVSEVRGKLARYLGPLDAQHVVNVVDDVGLVSDRQQLVGLHQLLR